MAVIARTRHQTPFIPEKTPSYQPRISHRVLLNLFQSGLPEKILAIGWRQGVARLPNRILGQDLVMLGGPSDLFRYDHKHIEMIAGGGCRSQNPPIQDHIIA